MLSRTPFASAFILSLSTILAFQSINSATACSIDGKSGFAPENDVKIHVNYVFAAAATMDEATFNQIIDRVENVYAPVVASKNAKLSVERNWTDPTVNAYAKREGEAEDEWIVAMFGGLARHPDMTNDGFMLVLCHEMGHHIGGAPVYAPRAPGRVEWASNEGQADYFGALKCMRRVLAQDNNEAIMRGVSVPAAYTKKCNKSFANAGDRALCARIAMAGDSLGKTLASLARESKPNTPIPDPATPDKSVVKQIFDAHPAAQCRLDTYFAASICQANAAVDVDQRDPTVGVCASEKKATFGYRPKCWYAPGKYAPPQPVVRNFSVSHRSELSSQIFY